MNTEKPYQYKRLGQVFLKDQNILNKMVTEASISPEDCVVEIGCGEGWLSQRLAERCKHLYILEIDERFLNITKERLAPFNNVTYLLGDALKTGFSPITESKFKVIANIPYQISTPLTKLFIAEKHRLETAFVLVQDEFAKKLTASANHTLYTSLSVYSQFFFETRYQFFVSKTCFRPVPKVDSAVLQLTPRTTPLFDVDDDIFFKIVRSAFWGRRKTMGKCLASGPYLSLNPSFKNDPTLQPYLQARGETFSLETFYQLYMQLKRYVC
jgi:16S rRNA (adenine1518-N6/adenine1519-N6)-dimethyltransferase